MSRRVLIDECVPRALRRELAGFNPATARDMGWSGLRNGMLMTRMREHGFDVLLTTDKNIVHQNVLAKHGVGLVLLRARRNNYPQLLPLMPRARVAVRNVELGQQLVVAAEDVE